MKTIILSFIISVSIFAQGTWVQQNSGTTKPLYGVSFIDEAVGWAVGGDGIIINTTDAGESWNPQTSGIVDRLNAVTFTDANIGWAVGANGRILKTTNGGINWASQTSGSSQELRSVYFVTATTGFAVGNGGTILKTTNGGSNWLVRNSGTTTNLYNISFYSATLGFAGGMGTTILKTTNAGESWSVSNTGAGGDVMRSIYFTSPMNGYAVGGTSSIGYINKTIDGGNSWTYVSYPTPSSFFYSVQFITESTGWICGYASDILKTTNGGANWINQNVSTAAYLWGICFPTFNLGYCVGDGGTILRYGQEAAWEKNINISDAGAQSGIITFGQSIIATNGLDPATGEFELPPLPPAGVFDIRFNLPTTPIIGSLKDYRYLNDTSLVWIMTFQPGAAGYPVTFDWTGGTLPALGNFFLRDYFGLVNVNMRTQNTYTLTNPAITTLKIEFTKIITRPVNILQGWNILSVPVNTLDMTANYLYPGATSYFFGYNNGYQIVNTLETSKGYWVKFGSSQSFQVGGNFVDPPNIFVNDDWNLIGPFDYDIPVADITSTPAGIIATNFFGFNNGYQIADTLKVGKGYWVRANQNGTLHLNNLLTTTPISDRQTAMALLEANFTITDGAGGTTLLKAGIDSLATDGLDPTLGEYEIPPIPPTGVFDARFNLPSSTFSTITDIRQGTFAGGFNRIHEIQYQVGAGTTIIINYDFGSYTADQVKARFQDVVTGTLIDTTVSGVGSYSVPNPGVFNKLKITMIYGTSIPVELTSFIASSIDKDVNLQWSTASETNNSGYSIERKSKNENIWSAVTFD